MFVCCVCCVFVCFDYPPTHQSAQAPAQTHLTLHPTCPPTHVQVSTINPGFHRTEMNKVAVQGLEACWSKVAPEVQAQYGPAYFEGCKDFVKTHTEDVVFDPINVVRALEHAVTSTRPRVQYRVGLDAKYGLVWTQIFPLRVGEKVIYALTTNKKMRSIVGLEKPAALAEAGGP